MKIKITTILILFITLAVIAVSFVYAYFYISDSDNQDREIGEVFILNPIFFENISGDVTPTEFETLTGYKKSGVYYIDVNSFENEYYINKLRINFEIQSNIETYFRVKIYDNLVVVYQNAEGKTVELSLPTTELIEYNIDGNNWYFDVATDWFYYKDTVTLADGIISFIAEGLNYPLQISEFKIQLGLVVEAVQAYRGPKENWNLDKRPWDGENWT